MKLDSGVRWNDDGREVEMKLDSGVRRNDDGETRHARARPAHLPLARDGRIKSDQVRP
jgi:hypothetical protein